MAYRREQLQWFAIGAGAAAQAFAIHRQGRAGQHERLQVPQTMAPPPVRELPP